MPVKDDPQDESEAEDDIDFDAINDAGEKVSELRDQMETNFGTLEEIIDEGEDLEFEDD